MGTLTIQLQPFFDWLLWVSLQGSVLIALIVLIQLILRGKLGIRWHYLLWMLLLIRLAVPYLPQSKISIYNLVPQSIQYKLANPISMTTDSIFRSKIVPCQTVTSENNIKQSKPETAQDTMPKPIEEPKTVASDTQPTNQNRPFGAILLGFVRMLPSIWLVGALLTAIFIFAQNISLWLTVKRQLPITDQKILDLLEDCKSEMGIRTILGVVITDKVTSPALFGFIRPRLLLPKGMLEALSLKELHHVFLHELAHLKRHDIYLGCLMSLLQVLHWFNPLIWLASYRMRADRELACDDLVLARTKSGEAKDYGRTIINLLERFSRPRHLPAMAGILETKSQLKRRIKMIVDFKKTSRIQCAGAMLLLGVLACVVLTNAHQAKADFTFGIQTKVPNVNSSSCEACVAISDDGLELYFMSSRPYGGDLSYGKLWVATRETTEDGWSEPVDLGPPVNSSAYGGDPSLSADDLELYFNDGPPPGMTGFTHRPGGYGGSDLWVSIRATKKDSWGEPKNLGTIINTSAFDGNANLTADGLQMFFSSNRPGGYGDVDIYVTTRATTDDPWGTPINLGPIINTSAWDSDPEITPDGLTLLFASWRSGGYGGSDIWITRRASTMAPWSQPVNIGPIVNTTDEEGDPSLSADGSILYFGRGRYYSLSSWDLCQVSISPVVDFNGDGKVDTNDLLILIDNWGINEPLCDIGPTLYGDGIVDMKDLEVFMSYWEKENIPVIPEDEL